MNPFSRVVHVTGGLTDSRAVYGCDGREFGCGFTSGANEMREHRRDCALSPSGQLYRVLRSA